MSVTISACDEDNMLELMRLYRSVTRQLERGRGLDDLFVNARSRRIFSMPFPSGMKKYESVVYNLFKTLRSLTGGGHGCHSVHVRCGLLLIRHSKSGCSWALYDSDGAGYLCSQATFQDTQHETTGLRCSMQPG